MYFLATVACVFIIDQRDNAWHRIMAQTPSNHKPEGRIFVIVWLPLVKLVHFRLPNKGVEVTTEILVIEILSATSVSKFCQVGGADFNVKIILSPIKTFID